MADAHGPSNSHHEHERLHLKPSFERVITETISQPSPDFRRYPGADGHSIRLVDFEGSPQIFINHSRENILSTRSSFVARYGDVWLATYPRSGTHWVWELMNMLLTKDFTLTPNYDKENRHLEFHHSAQFEDGGQQGRLFNTHFSYSLMPPSVFEKQNKIVVLMRHPLELAVSCYHMTRDQPPMYDYTGSWDSYFQLFMEGSVDRGSWFDHVLDWWDNCKDLDHVYFTTYEQLKKDMPGFCRSLAAFLDVPLTEQEILAMKDATDITRMRNHKACENVAFDGKISKHIRKGESGAAQCYYSETQLDDLENMLIKRLGESELRHKFEMPSRN